MNFPFDKNNEYFNFKLKEEEFATLSIALNESFALFEIKEEDEFDYNKIANLVYNIIQSKLQKFENLLNNDNENNNDLVKNNENNNFKLNILKKYKDKLKKYFFFKDYNSTKKYDNISVNKLEELIKNNIEKAKKTKIPKSKIKELETKLKNKKNKEEVIEIIENIIENVEKIRNFFSHIYHKNEEIKLKDCSIDFLNLLYRVAYFVNNKKEIEKDLFINGNNKFSLESIIFMFSLFSYKSTIFEAISQLGFKRFLYCKKQGKCSECNNFNLCQKELNIIKNTYTYFSIPLKFKKTNDNDKNFRRIITILDFLYRQSYNFKPTKDKNGNDIQPLDKVDNNFDFERNKKETMSIFCDFLTDVILDKSNYKFKEKYSKYGLDNIENYQVDRYDIYNNNINLINSNCDKNSIPYYRIGINELKHIVADKILEIEDKKEIVNIKNDFKNFLKNSGNSNKIKHEIEEINKNTKSLDYMLKNRKEFLIEKLSKEKEIIEKEIEDYKNNIYIEYKNNEIHKRIEHILKFIQTFMLKEKINDVSIFEGLRKELQFYDKQSISNFKNNNFSNILIDSDNFLEKNDIKLKWGKLTTANNLKEFYLNILNKELEIIEKITIYDKEYLKKIGLKKSKEINIKNWIITLLPKHTKKEEIDNNKKQNDYENNFCYKIQKINIDKFSNILKNSIFKPINERLLLVENKEQKETIKLKQKQNEIYRLNVLVLAILKYYIENLKTISGSKYEIELQSIGNSISECSISLKINDENKNIKLTDLLKDYLNSNIDAIATAYKFLSKDEIEKELKKQKANLEKNTEDKKEEKSEMVLILKRFRKECKELLPRIFEIEHKIIKANGKDKISHKNPDYISFDEIVKFCENTKNEEFKNNINIIKNFRNMVLHNSKPDNKDKEIGQNINFKKDDIEQKINDLEKQLKINKKNNKKQ